MRICPNCETPTLERVCPEDGYQTVEAALFMQPEADPFVGTVFLERYRIEERLAIGGMGTVYRGEQLTVGRSVAVKILRKEVVSDLRVIARFQQEALAVAGLHHPNTVRIFDYGQSDAGDLFLVMEFLEGEPLAVLIDREAPLQPSRVIHIGGQILDSLAEAHQNRIIHRDLKPDNIFVTKVGLQPDFVKVLDFGIAKLDRGEARKRQITQTGVVVGSPGYMAPEQVQSLPMTGKVDLYAVGAVMYEMLTGKAVFDGESAFEIAMKHVHESPPQPVANGRPITGPLIDLILSLLEKNPDKRPQDATAALRELKDCMSDYEGTNLSHIGPLAELSEEFEQGGRVRHRTRKSTSVFFSPGTGMSGHPAHRLWIALLILMTGGLGYGGYRLMNADGDPVKPLGDIKSEQMHAAQQRAVSGSNAAVKDSSEPSSTKPKSDAAKKATVAGATVKATPPHSTVAMKKSSAPSLPLKVVPPAPLKTVVRPAGLSESIPVVRLAGAVARPDDHWVHIQGSPKGTRIYMGGKLVGKTEIILKWSAGTKPPRLTMKKWRYETYAFRVPKRKYSQTYKVRLEWDDSR